ncbi:hypothetical protein [Gracilimonas mengyeensis]|uniref:Outer membrane insertion C-terminal signal n=1 Tax=Gracilimonas mengyeensis TaxID=1302730 RepID=A0A521BR94_9BACT|nr:hypothetical protein [Gracilimonas mengyeensis]SMO49692.1 hypothetical protein SAMN06265219_1033 [Gracilimonas mengyeensis]
MKKYKLIPLLFIMAGIIAVSSPDAKAQTQEGGDLGIGVMLGEPTGLSFKLWNNDRSALAFGAAWSFGAYDALHLHGDYLLHSWFNEVDQGELAFYYGIGARFLFADPDSKVGVRVPFGLNYHIQDAPVDVFIEAVPILNLTPATEFDGNGALGIRYYF